MSLYATLADFYSLGMRREALVSPARTIASVDVAANTMTLVGHGFIGGEPIQFSVAGQAFPVTVASAPPAPLSSSTGYYALAVGDSDSLFQVSAAIGGSAIDLTSAGVGTLTVTQQIAPFILRALDIASSRIDQALVAYEAELTTWPEVITWATCKLAAWQVIQVRGLLNPSYEASAKETLAVDMAAVERQLDMWRRGALVFGAVVDATPGLLESGTVSGIDVEQSWLTSTGAL